MNEILVKASGSWPTIINGDPNTIDLWWYAGRVAEVAGHQCPVDVLDKTKGRTIVEIVEREFVASDLIRDRAPTEIARRAMRVVEEIEKQSLLSFGGIDALVAALFTWHGCLCMAKSLRPTHVTPTGEAAYSLELRKQGYAKVQEQWKDAELHGNPWIRYGVSVARKFSLARGNPIIEDWVPKDSPYWE